MRFFSPIFTLELMWTILITKIVFKILLFRVLTTILFNNLLLKFMNILLKMKKKKMIWTQTINEINVRGEAFCKCMTVRWLGPDAHKRPIFSFFEYIFIHPEMRKVKSLNNKIIKFRSWNAHNVLPVSAVCVVLLDWTMTLRKHTSTLTHLCFFHR